MELRIELSPEAEAMLSRMRSSGPVLRAMARAMDRENQATIAHISTVRMRGNDGKPFPPELHVLGVRTARLRRSLRAVKAEVSGEVIESGIGSNVKYAGVHEFGGRIEVPPRAVTVRLKETRKGELARQIGFENLAVFAKRTAKRAREVRTQRRGYTIEMPARAPIRSGIEDRLAAYGAALSEAVKWAWGQKE